jgi:hypothetical protein
MEIVVVLDVEAATEGEATLATFGGLAGLEGLASWLGPSTLTRRGFLRGAFSGE